MGCARGKLWYVIADNVVLVVQDGIYGLVRRLFVFNWVDFAGCFSRFGFYLD